MSGVTYGPNNMIKTREGTRSFLKICHNDCYLSGLFSVYYAFSFDNIITCSVNQTTDTHRAYHDSGESRDRSKTGEACGVAGIQHVGNYPTDTSSHKTGVQGMTSREHERSTVQQTYVYG